MKHVIIFILLTTSLRAEVLSRNGKNFVLKKSTFKVSELLSDYVKLEKISVNIGEGFEDGTFAHQGSTSIPEAKIEKYVSTLLGQSGNSMVRMPGSRFLNVFSSRVARYATLPVYKEAAEIPDNDNLVQFSYTLKHIEASSLVRNMRPFLGRWGRIIDVAHSNSIHIADNAINVKRQVQLIQFLDSEEFLKSKKEIDDINEKHKKIIRREKSWFEIFSENNGIFLIVFLSLGLIMGFGIRGYMMKRVEGGW